jgi:diguanylate cyclase (GGDEF)-like protein
VIILPQTDSYGASVVAKRIFHSFAEIHFPVSKDENVPVSVSIGSASKSRPGEEPAALIRMADEALLRAKTR